jgi:hypothetical protein
LINLEQRFDRFLEAHPAHLVHVHGNDWLPRELVERARARKPVLVTPGDAADPARCAQMYRQVGP